MSRRSFRSLGHLFSDIAGRKERAARARFAGRRPGVEPSRDVYLDACARVAAAFEDDGFRYAKSGPHCSRQVGIFQHRVAFGTSHHNIPGEHVDLHMGALVRCASLRRWRRQQRNPTYRDDQLAGGAVHRLDDELTHVSWDLADRGSRDRVIGDIVGFVREIVLPYFDRFRDPESVLAGAIEGGIRMLPFTDAAELALSLDRREEAVAILRHFTASRPHLGEAIREAEHRLATAGFPDHRPTEYSEGVAWLRVAYGLD